MFNDHFAAAIGCARPAALDELHKAVTDLWGRDKITEEEASFGYALIEARRDAFRNPTLPGLPPISYNQRPPLPRTRFPAPRYQPARRHPERIARRRQLAASGPLPPALAAQFTTSQLSVLAIVADEAGANGQCTLYLDEIAARAGTCRTTARTALRLAERHGLLSRQERRRPGRASLTTILRVVSAEWRLWITHGGRRAKRHRCDLLDRLSCEVTGVKNTSRTGRLRQYKNGQPLLAPPKGPSGGLRPPAKAGLGGARQT